MNQELVMKILHSIRYIACSLGLKIIRCFVKKSIPSEGFNHIQVCVLSLIGGSVGSVN